MHVGANAFAERLARGMRRRQSDSARTAAATSVWDANEESVMTCARPSSYGDFNCRGYSAVTLIYSLGRTAQCAESEEHRVRWLSAR